MKAEAGFEIVGGQRQLFLDDEGGEDHLRGTGLGIAFRARRGSRWASKWGMSGEQSQGKC